MAPVIVKPDRIREFESAADFETWLAAHHAGEPEVWIRIFKVASGRATVTPAQAVDVCLAWGWIDAIRKRHDEASFLQRYTPRGAKSIWSLVNVRNVERLTAAGRMTAHGLRHVESAKADGRWDRAYAGSRDMVVPEDLRVALETDSTLLAAFDALSAQNRFAHLFRLHAIRSADARRRRIEALVLILRDKRTPHPQDGGRPPQ